MQAPDERTASRETGGPRQGLFGPRATTLLRSLLVSFVLFLAVWGAVALAYYHSPYWNGVGIHRDQPVLFSHRHHTGELGIDCRYCHATVETSAFAGLPSTSTCLTCHSQLFTDTAMLEPVVRSATEGKPLHWNRVNALPDHVHFNHAIHVAKGVGCTTCHGDVGEMPLTAKGTSTTMRWCIDCHREPAPHLRPREEIFAITWEPPADQAARGRELALRLNVHTTELTNCSTCHN